MNNEEPIEYFEPFDHADAEAEEDAIDERRSRDEFNDLMADRYSHS